MSDALEVAVATGTDYTVYEREAGNSYTLHRYLPHRTEGWINYYGRFRKSELLYFLRRFNRHLPRQSCRKLQSFINDTVSGLNSVKVRG